MTEPKHIPLPDFARFVEERANRLAEAIGWVFGIDDRPVMDDDVTEEAPEVWGGGCECWVTPEHLWTTHYGAVEPGSQLEFNPDCPKHGKGQ